MRTARPPRRLLASPVTHAILFAAFIFALSSMPDPPVLGPMPLNDKLKHLALYAAFALLVARAVSAPGRRTWQTALLTILIVSAYGATDEYHQRFTPGRSCDARDWQADTLAACAVAALLAARPPRRAA